MFVLHILASFYILKSDHCMLIIQWRLGIPTIHQQNLASIIYGGFFCRFPIKHHQKLNRYKVSKVDKKNILYQCAKFLGKPGKVPLSSSGYFCLIFFYFFSVLFLLFHICFHIYRGSGLGGGENHGKGQETYYGG